MTWARWTSLSPSDLNTGDRGRSFGIVGLMDATFAAQDQRLKILLATLEKQAREYKQEIEGRLGVRN
ncbi:MAG: hypothetical protein M1376_01545 [Planctomycetes bacterium]|nr:hypothetical protein [Planctomycetota bacterium]